MECHENGKTVWLKLGAMLEVTIIKLGWDGKNWNDPYLMFRTPPWRGVGRIGGVVALLSLLTSSIVYKVWFKGTSTKALEEGRFGHFLLQLSLSLGSHFQPPTFNLCSCRTCKSFHERGLNTLLQGNLQGGGVIFRTIEVPTTLEKMGSRLILE
jgi:hypothetical protein